MRIRPPAALAVTGLVAAAVLGLTAPPAGAATPPAVRVSSGGSLGCLQAGAGLAAGTVRPVDTPGQVVRPILAVSLVPKVFVVPDCSGTGA